MNDLGAGRVGIFEYDWSMYSFVKDFIIKLAEAGYTVDVFHKAPGVSPEFTDPGQFVHCPGVRYLKFNTSNKMVEKVAGKLRGILRRLSWNYRQSPRGIIDPEILLRSRRIVDESQYQCFIGVEKKGLIWAGLLSQIYALPLIYYSLELYLEDHPLIKSYSFLRKAEKKYHQLSGATIIQDRRRAEALMEYNEIETARVIYFPISVRGSIVANQSRFLYQKYAVNGAKRLVLYFGEIGDGRFSADLVRMSNYLNDDSVLVLHGYGDQTYLTYLRSIADVDRVIFSFEFVADEEITSVISSATIGLALYKTTNSNDRLAAFSSVKVAYYLQCGVPVIAFDSDSFRELMNAFRCGELVGSIDEIPRKVERILSDYDSYRQGAFMAFREFYDFDKNFVKFKSDFEDFIRDGDSR